MSGDPDIDQEHAPHADISRLLVTSLALLWILVCGLLWNLQPWQRPWITRIPDERLWLVLYGSGLLALVVTLRPWPSFARFVSRSVGVLAAGALVLGGLHQVCENLAVSTLKSRWKDELFLYEKQLGHGLHAPRSTLASKLKDWLETQGVGSPSWLDAYVRKQSENPVRAIQGLVATSDWRIRRKFADAMMRDEISADYLMSYWREYFPAIIGQDVSLQYRRVWLGDLDALRKEPGHALSTRQATLIMMALIILTDPPEFEPWRVPVRDAMIQLREPRMDRWTGQGQMFWHRSLDALLALDPPDSWARLTKPMLVEGAAFRQAAEAPVRGLFGNFDAFLPIFENCKDREDLFFYWQCAGSALEEHPESFDAETAERIRSWRRDILFRWLMALGDGSRDDLTGIQPPVLDMLDSWPVPQMSDGQQQQLVTTALALIENIRARMDLSMETDAADVTRMLHILPYLKDKHADAAFERFIPVLLQPERYAGKTSRGYTFGKAWMDCLDSGMQRMTEVQLRLLQQRLRPLMQNLDFTFIDYRSMLALDACAKHPALSRDQWLLMAWGVGRPWRTMPEGESRDLRTTEETNIPIVPEFSKEDIDSFVGNLAFALQDQDEKSFEQAISERFQVFTTIEPKKAYQLKRMAYRLRSLGIHKGMPADELEREVKADFVEMGLCPMEASITETLLERARRRKYLTGAFLFLPEVADRFWSGALEDPARAAAVAIDGLEHGYAGEVINSLILAIERGSPGDDVIRSVWDALRARCHDHENGRQVFGALFRLSGRVSASERSAMRKDYMAARPGWLVSVDADDWGYQSTVAYYISVSSASPILPMGYDSNPLHYAGGGIGIPWEEDALSAKLSWKSMVDRQMYPQPRVDTSKHLREVFTYLAAGFEVGSHSGIRSQRLSPQRLVAPFPPTPWQKARELYVRHPDWEME